MTKKQKLERLTSEICMTLQLVFLTSFYHNISCSPTNYNSTYTTILGHLTLHFSLHFLGNEQKISFSMSTLYSQNLVKLEWLSSKNILLPSFTLIYSHTHTHTHHIVLMETSSRCEDLLLIRFFAVKMVVSRAEQKITVYLPIIQLNMDGIILQRVQ